jgi:hypothetical protein
VKEGKLQTLLLAQKNFQTQDVSMILRLQAACAKVADSAGMLQCARALREVCHTAFTDSKNQIAFHTVDPQEVNGCVGYCQEQLPAVTSQIGSKPDGRKFVRGWLQEILGALMSSRLGLLQYASLCHSQGHCYFAMTAFRYLTSILYAEQQSGTGISNIGINQNANELLQLAVFCADQGYEGLASEAYRLVHLANDTSQTPSSTPSTSGAPSPRRRAGSLEGLAPPRHASTHLTALLNTSDIPSGMLAAVPHITSSLFGRQVLHHVLGSEMGSSLNDFALARLNLRRRKRQEQQQQSPGRSLTPGTPLGLISALDLTGITPVEAEVKLLAHALALRYNCNLQTVKLWKFGLPLPVKALRGNHSVLDLGLPCRQGMILKESTHFRSWRQRWAVLDSASRELNFYEQTDVETHDTPTETIQLADVLSVEGAPERHSDRKAFCVKTKYQNFYLAPDSVEEMEQWMSDIHQNTHHNRLLLIDVLFIAGMLKYNTITFAAKLHSVCLPVQELRGSATSGATVQAVSLNFDGDKLHEMDCIIIEEMLEGNSAVQAINMTGSPLQVHKLQSDATLVATAGGATDSGRVVSVTEGTLDLSQQHIQDMDANLIGKLMRTAALVKLDLRNNMIGSSGLVTLASALKANQMLTSLDVSSNKLLAKGITPLCEALRSNVTLHCLNVADNSLCADGAKIVAEMLEVNGGLTDLDLSSNQLALGNSGGKKLALSYDFDGVMALCKSLYSSDAITSLNLSTNAMGSPDTDAKPVCTRALARVISNNDTLTNVGLSKNGFEVDAGRDILAASFRENATLTMLNGMRLDIVKVEIWHLS